MKRKFRRFLIILVLISFLPVIYVSEEYGSSGGIINKYNTSIKYPNYSDLRTSIYVVEENKGTKYYGLWLNGQKKVPTGELNFHLLYEGTKYQKFIINDASITMMGKKHKLQQNKREYYFKLKGAPGVSQGSAFLNIHSNIKSKDLERFDIQINAKLIEENGKQHELVYDKEIIQSKDITVWPLFWHFIFWNFIFHPV